MKLTNILAGAAFATSVAASAFADGHATELKFANFTPPFHTVNASVIEMLNAELSAATDGALTVRGYHGGELGAGPVEQYVRAVQGVADIAWGLPGYTSSQFGKTMIAELPGALADDQPGYAALWAAYDDHLAGEFPGTVPLALWTSEPNVFIMVETEVHSPSDLEGLKIRVAGATSAAVIEAMGGTPVQMPINQVYNAMQTGLIDGVLTGSSTLSDFRLNEVASAVTLGAPMGRLTFYAVMNEGAYGGLSDDQRAALDAVARMPVSQSAEEAWNAAAGAALEAARADDGIAVIDLSDDEIAAFADAVASVAGDYVDSVGGGDALAAMQGM